MGREDYILKDDKGAPGGFGQVENFSVWRS